MTKILFVCPQAHYAGHHPRAATLEPEFLRQAGHDVKVLTFCGIMGGGKSDYTVIKPNGTIDRILAKARRSTFARWVMMGIENFLTQDLGIAICRADKRILHLRDGEPFLIIPPILDFFWEIRWCISMTGSVMYAPKVAQKGISAKVYKAVLGFMSGRLSLFLYRLTVKRMLFTCQNEKTALDLEKFMSVFKGRVRHIPLTVGERKSKLAQWVAREQLELPPDAFIILSWGAPHQGKDLRVVFDAVSRLDGNTLLLHGGKHSFSLGNNLPDLAKRYSVNLKMNNEYIPEELKPVYFDASDVVVLSYTPEFKSSSSVLVESVLFDIPIIASDSQAIAKDVTQYGLGRLFKAGDADSLLVQLQEVRKGHAVFDSSGRSIYLNVHGTKAFAEGYGKVYQELEGK